MKYIVLSRKKIDALANALLLIGLGVLLYTNLWWPGILLVVWASLGLKQWLTNRKFDLIITSVILWGLFIASYLDLKWNVLIPVLFFLGALYIIFREFFFSEDTNGEEKSQEIIDDADIKK